MANGKEKCIRCKRGLVKTGYRTFFELNVNPLVSTNHGVISAGGERKFVLCLPCTSETGIDRLYDALVYEAPAAEKSAAG